MTELERRGALAGAIVGPNASYDSAIDSLPSDDCYCDLTAKLSRSTVASFTTIPYQSKSSHQTLISVSMNGPILFNSNSSNPTQHLASQAATNAALFYRSLADYHCLHSVSSCLNDQIHQGQRVAQPMNATLHSQIDPKLLDEKTSMALFLDQIDVSSSLLHSGQTRPHNSSSTRQTGHSSRRGATESGIQQKHLSESELSASDNIHSCDAPRIRHSGEYHQRQAGPQQVYLAHSPTANTTLSASSLLRSSRSFTTSYRQRPNVTRKCFRFIVPSVHVFLADW